MNVIPPSHMFQNKPRQFLLGKLLQLILRISDFLIIYSDPDIAAHLLAQGFIFQDHLIPKKSHEQKKDILWPRKNLMKLLPKKSHMSWRPQKVASCYWCLSSRVTLVWFDAFRFGSLWWPGGRFFFCSTSLPLASSEWVRSTSIKLFSFFTV